jgi:hypothetical protein
MRTLESEATTAFAIDAFASHAVAMVITEFCRPFVASQGAFDMASFFFVSILLTHWRLDGGVEDGLLYARFAPEA